MNNVLILGAGGRDFHLFNTVYRADPATKVVAFSANQIPGIAGRHYPPVLSGELYPEGIPIVDEADLEAVVAERAVSHCVFAYSDVSLEYVARLKARVEATGASFSTFDPEASMLRSSKPVIAVCAARTGCGKSAVSRHIAAHLRDAGHRPAILRHPMPYGQLDRQVCQRFAAIEDLARHECTVEEMEEYEPVVAMGLTLFAGADYAAILAAAEAEADVIIWDGGNNDASFLAADVYVTLLDPLRAGDELRYFPSRYNLERADVLLLTKTDTASAEQVAECARIAAEHNADALVLRGTSPYALADPEAVRGRRALVVEDGPTTLHGGMAMGAGFLAAQAGGAAEIVDPRPFAVGAVAAAFQQYTHLENVLPALGYSAQQLADLTATIDATPCDVVVVGTPIDLSRVIDISKEAVRVSYAYADADGSTPLAEEVVSRLSLPPAVGVGGSG